MRTGQLHRARGRGTGCPLPGSAPHLVTAAFEPFAPWELSCRRRFWTQEQQIGNTGFWESGRSNPWNIHQTQKFRVASLGRSLEPAGFPTCSPQCIHHTGHRGQSGQLSTVPPDVRQRPGPPAALPCHTKEADLLLVLRPGLFGPVLAT